MWGFPIYVIYVAVICYFSIGVKIQFILSFPICDTLYISFGTLHLIAQCHAIVVPHPGIQCSTALTISAMIGEMILLYETYSRLNDCV
jgi:hypothetical protein